MAKITHYGPGLLLIIDDTDSDTPAMVYDRKKQFSATWHCATDTGELEGVGLRSSQIEWLKMYEDEVDLAFNKARASNPEYK